MKSILQEASSVERAIDKAWNEAGKPKEFTIKILDHGERNFFGLTRRPAIVSILYKPEKSTYEQPRSRSRDDRRSDRRSDRRGDRRSSDSSGRRSSRSSSSSNAQSGWRDEWQTHVTDNVRQVLKRMNIKTSFDAKVTEDKVLTLTFKSAVLPDAEEQRMFFASLSYLSIQFLKREYKNRFTGFRIVVTGPEPKGQKAAPKEDAPEKSEARQESGSSERRSSGRRSSSRSGGRGSSRSSSRSRKSDAGSNGDHADEQLKFAQQQLEREDEHEVFERAPVKEEAPAESAEKPKAAQDAKKEAKKADNRPAPRAEAKPLKKETKYQPFFILPDEQDGDK